MEYNYDVNQNHRKKKSDKNKGLATMKQKLILCTVGSSIANRCKSLQQAQANFQKWEDDLTYLPQELNEKINKCNLSDSKQIQQLSAELNTLNRMNVKKVDIVVLLSTDSALGKICTEKLKETIEKLYFCKVFIERVENLQVYDSAKLKESGLKNLVKILWDKYLNNNEYKYSYDIILNPIGGYKGIIPFVSILGMLKGRYSVYLFEFSEELIKLPPLPLSIDFDIYSRAKEALLFLEKEVATTKEAYLGKIKNLDSSEYDIFLSFTEPFEDDTITLSPLAYVTLNIDNTDKKTMISKIVLEKVKKLNGNKKIIIERMIQNSSNPLWREQKRHMWSDTDLFPIKPGNTSERIAGFVKDDTFYVTLVYSNHDEYEKDLGRWNVKDFDNAEFVEWEPEEIEEITTNSFDELQLKYDQLFLTNKILEEENLEVQILKEEVEEKETELKKGLLVMKNLQEQHEQLKTKEQKFKNLSFLEKVKLLFFK